MTKTKHSALKELTCWFHSTKKYLRDTLVGSVVQDGGSVLEAWPVLARSPLLGALYQASSP